MLFYLESATTLSCSNTRQYSGISRIFSKSLQFLRICSCSVSADLLKQLLLISIILMQIRIQLPIGYFPSCIFQRGHLFDFLTKNLDTYLGNLFWHLIWGVFFINRILVGSIFDMTPATNLKHWISTEFQELQKWFNFFSESANWRKISKFLL